jgi:hypothetical protein
VTIIDWQSTKGCVVNDFEGTTLLWTANQYSKTKKILTQPAKHLSKLDRSLDSSWNPCFDKRFTKKFLKD